jgi:hypothetical protein
VAKKINWVSIQPQFLDGEGQGVLTSREADRDLSSGAFLFRGFGGTDDITGFRTSAIPIDPNSQAAKRILKSTSI